MDAPVTMHGVEGGQDHQRLLDGFTERQWPARQPLLKCLALQILHDEEVRLAFPANVEEHADVRVVQGGDGAGLTLESLLEIRITGDMLGQHLDGDGAVEAGVGGLVDLAHAPGAEGGGVDLVGAECGAGLERHGDR